MKYNACAQGDAQQPIQQYSHTRNKKPEGNIKWQRREQREQREFIIKISVSQRLLLSKIDIEGRKEQFKPAKPREDQQETPNKVRQMSSHCTLDFCHCQWNQDIELFVALQRLTQDKAE